MGTLRSYAFVILVLNINIWSSYWQYSSAFQLPIITSLRTKIKTLRPQQYSLQHENRNQKPEENNNSNMDNTPSIIHNDNPFSSAFGTFILSSAMTTTTTAAAAAVSLIIMLSSPLLAFADTTVGWDGHVLQPCPTKSNSNCVSSSSNEPPNRYLSPLRIVKDRSIAFENAVKDLEQQSLSSNNNNNNNNNNNIKSNNNNIQIVDIIPSEYYIHLQVPGTAPNSVDDIELQFTEAGTVNIRCHAQVTLPYAPFCIKKNCINGAQDQRDRLEQLALQVLGLPFADAIQMKSSAKWTPIFFNADRVPDMILDEDDF